MDWGPPLDSRATMRRRVSSPRAANIGAVRLGLSALADIFFDRRHLRRPASIVTAIRIQAAGQRNALESRFYNREQGAFGASASSKTTSVVGSGA